MNIVVLEADSLGSDVSWEPINSIGDVTLYGVTQYDQIIERIKNAEVIVPNKCVINKEVIDNAPNLKLICEAATGYNNIDIDYAKQKGIVVTNVVNYSTPVVAQHTFALLLSLFENISYYNNYVKSGNYSKSGGFTHLGKALFELEGKTWGIIGMGNIGRKVSDIASAFGCEVLYYSASGNVYNDVKYKNVSLEKLLAKSDVVSIHCPLNKKTNNLIDYDKLCIMKSTAYLINVARGPIVNENDLAKALNENIISGAGLDVFSKEPISEDSPLMKISDNGKLILTPHIGWGSREARERLVANVAKSISGYYCNNIRSRVN